jgi:nitrite reductase (NADH) small subunit
MALLKNLIIGRPKGIRRSFVRKLLSADSSAPVGSSSDSVVFEGVTAGGASKKEPPKDITPPDGFEVVLHRDSLQPGEVAEVIIAGRAIAIVNMEGTFHALSNTCPHSGGPLSEGHLEKDILSCPYHGWGFSIETGACVTNPDASINIYEACVEGDAVCVRL